MEKQEAIEYARRWREAHEEMRIYRNKLQDLGYVLYYTPRPGALSAPSGAFSNPAAKYDFRKIVNTVDTI